MMSYSVSDTGILGKRNSEFSQQESNLRPSESDFQVATLLTIIQDLKLEKSSKRGIYRLPEERLLRLLSNDSLITVKLHFALKN